MGHEPCTGSDEHHCASGKAECNASVPVALIPSTRARCENFTEPQGGMIFAITDCHP